MIANTAIPNYSLLDTTRIDVSVVMPCLNEAETLGICIEKAQSALKKLAIVGEVIVADNGSTDNSVEIAKQLGARVVHQPDTRIWYCLCGVHIDYRYYLCAAVRDRNC